MNINITRRDMLRTLTLGTVGAAVQTLDTNVFGQDKKVTALRELTGDPRIRGPFPILSTPFLENGEVDYNVLGRQAKFVDWCGCSGMIWPQAGDAVDLLTQDEKIQGMTVLADALKERQKSALCLGVNGKNADDVLVYARKAKELGADAIISRPPDDGQNEDDMYAYYRAIAKEVECPVIIQTSGGTQYHGPAPSLKLLLDLAKEFPHFGYVKEETPPIEQRMRQLVEAKPTIKRVFSAMGGFGWLRQCRIGTEGLITERAVYADLLEFIWREADSGDKVIAADAFGKLLLMLNLKESIPCNQLRGFHLYVWQKRGVFKNMLSREYGPKSAVPEKPILSEMKLTDEEKEEIDARFAALKPYLRKGEFKG